MPRCGSIRWPWCANCSSATTRMVWNSIGCVSVITSRRVGNGRRGRSSRSSCERLVRLPTSGRRSAVIRILLGVRVPAHPDAAAGLGMDGVAWAREGLVDLIVPCPFWSSSDFDIPVELWRERLGEAADKVTVAPGLEYNARPWPGGAAVANDLACTEDLPRRLISEAPTACICSTGWTVKHDLWKSVTTKCCCAMGSRPKLCRVHFAGIRCVTGTPYRQVSPAISNLPVDAQAGGSFRIHSGPKPASADVWAVVGLASAGHRQRHALGGVAQRSSVGRGGRRRQCAGTGRWRDPCDSHPVPARDCRRRLQHTEHSSGRRIDSATNRVGRTARRRLTRSCQRFHAEFNWWTDMD